MSIAVSGWSLVSTSEVWDHVQLSYPGQPVGVSHQADGSMLIESPVLTDANLSSAIAGWTPTTIDGSEYQPALPPAIAQAVSDFRAFMPVANGTITTAQRDALIKDLIRCVNYLAKQIAIT